MNTGKIKTHLPTVAAFMERRKKARENRLPKHLRPLPTLPIWIQVTLNSALVIALFNMMVDRDDYLTEAGPAIALVACLLLLIYSLISAMQLRHRYLKIRGARLAKFNFALMILAFLSWAATIVVFLP